MNELYHIMGEPKPKIEKTLTSASTLSFARYNITESPKMLGTIYRHYSYMGIEC